MFRPAQLNRLVAVWLACYATLSWAGTTLAQDVRAYDWESLAWAGAAGLLGGVGRFILSLASDRDVVLRIPPGWWRGVLASVLAGLAGYVVVQGGSAFVQTYLGMQGVPRDVRTMILVVAGWMGLRFFGQLDEMGAAVATRIGKQIGAGELPAAVLPPADPPGGTP